MLEKIHVEMCCSKDALAGETGQHWKKTSAEDHIDACFFVRLGSLLTLHYSKKVRMLAVFVKWFNKGTWGVLARQKFKLSSSINLVNAD